MKPCRHGRDSLPHPARLTSDTLQVTIWYGVRIRTFAHAGLRRLYQRDQARGLPPDAVDKLRKILAFLQDMETEQEVRTIPGWRAHQLTGDRQGTWSLRVTGNWRLTFRVEAGDLVEVNYEDYHG